MFASRRNDPYAPRFIVDLDTNVDPVPLAEPAPQVEIDPERTLHADLAGRVDFEPYPKVLPVLPHIEVPKTQLQRLFLGQLPYDVTPQQVEWIVYVTTGCCVKDIEKIQKWTANRQPRGCVHAYCLPEQMDTIVHFLHRRVLVDDTGIWVATNEEQHTTLEAYCATMKQDKTLRFRERPYQPVVVQAATSTFVPRAQLPEYQLPPTYNEHVQAYHPPVQ